MLMMKGSLWFGSDVSCPSGLGACCLVLCLLPLGGAGIFGGGEV